MTKKQVEVTTQAEFDKAAARGDWIVVRKGFYVAWDQATVEAGGQATVRAGGQATVRAGGQATVRAGGQATVEAWDQATVEAGGQATVEAWGQATVRAGGQATVEAWGQATVRAWGQATVEAWDQATVEAWDQATVRAWGQATVRAWDQATVRAGGQATVEAWGQATVEAWAAAQVSAAGRSKITASKFVAITKIGNDVQVIEGSNVIEIPVISTIEEWCEFHDVGIADGLALVYKGVGDDLRSCSTQGHPVTYTPGTTVEARDWRDTATCGNGLHFSARPFETLKYVKAKRFLACRIPIADAVVITDYNGALPDKIKAKSCEVLYECDIDGNQLAEVAVS